MESGVPVEVEYGNHQVGRPGTEVEVAEGEIALVGMPDPRLGERSCAYIVPRDQQNPPALAGICACLEAQIALYETCRDNASGAVPPRRQPVIKRGPVPQSAHVS
jgi:acyl-CoA synthetase (AMP-forming)/AMP-acid ligase II